MAKKPWEKFQPQTTAVASEKKPWEQFAQDDKKKSGSQSPPVTSTPTQEPPVSAPQSGTTPAEPQKGFLGTLKSAYDELVASAQAPAEPGVDKPSPILNAIKRGVNLGDQAEIVSPFSAERPTEEKLQRLAAIQKENQELPASPAYDKFNNSKTVMESLTALSEKPVQIIGELTVESLAGLANYGATRMAAGAATGGALGSVIPGVGTGAGIGSGVIAGLADTSLALEFTGSFVESLTEAGVDVTDPKSLQKAFEDDDLIEKARTHAYKKGIPIALFDLISGGIAGKIVTKPAKSLVSKIGLGAAEFGTQAALGGSGELAGQLTAGENVNPSAIIAEMIGELGTTPVEVSANLLGRTKKAVQETAQGGPPEAPTPIPVTPTEPPITPEAVATPGPQAAPAEPQESAVPVIAQQIEQMDEAKLTSPEVKAQRNEIKETIHSVAEEAGIDINTPEFKAASKEITGKAHLDKMNTRHLGRMLQYVQGEKEVGEGTVLFNQFLQDEESQKQSGEAGGQGAIQQDAPQENIQAQEEERQKQISDSDVANWAKENGYNISDKDDFDTATKMATQRPNYGIGNMIFGKEDRTEERRDVHKHTYPKTGKTYKWTLGIYKNEKGSKRYLLYDEKYPDQIDAGAVVDKDGKVAHIRTDSDFRSIGLAQTLLREIKKDYGKIIPSEPISKQGAKSIYRFEKEGLLSQKPEAVAGKSTTIVETPKEQTDGSSSKKERLRGEKTSEEVSSRTAGLKTGPAVSKKSPLSAEAKRVVMEYDEEARNPSIPEKDREIAGILTTTKLDRSSVTRFGDNTNITPSMAKQYIVGKGKGATLDQVAERVSNSLGIEVTPEEVWDFMRTYPQGPKTITTPSGNPKLAEISNRYVELTGRGLNQKIARDIVAQPDFYDAIADGIATSELEERQKNALETTIYETGIDEVTAANEDKQIDAIIAAHTENGKINWVKLQENMDNPLGSDPRINTINELDKELYGKLTKRAETGIAAESEQGDSESNVTKPSEGIKQRGLAERIRSAIRSLRSAKTEQERVKIATQIKADSGKYLLNRQGVITGSDASFADNKSDTFFDLIDDKKSVYLMDETSKIAESKEDYEKINAKLKDKVKVVNGSIMFDDAFAKGAIEAARDLGYDAVRLTEIDGTNSTLQILNYDKLTHITGEDFVADRILPKGPHQIEAEARVKKAEQSVKSATEAIAKKKTQLGKSLAQDQVDIFGKRKGDEGKLFEEGAGDRAAAKKQLDALNKDLEQAKNELDKANKALEVAKKADKNTLFKSKDEKANDLLAEGFSDLADVVGAKKNITGNQAKLNDALVKIGKGLILKGEATIDNVIDKIREFLKSKGVNVTDEQLKAIKSEIKKQTTPKKKRKRAKPGARKKSVFQRLDFARAEIIKTFGENYQPQSNEETKNLTDEFIKRMGGIDKAFAARDFAHSAVKAILYAEKLESLKTRMDTDKDAMSEYMQLMNEFDLIAREGGQAIQILDYIYQNYGVMFTAENQIKKFKEANGGHIPAEMAVKFKELEKKHEELEEKVKKLQEERDQMQGKVDLMNIKQANKRSGNIRKQKAQEMIQEAKDERSKLWKELAKMSSARAEIVPVTAITYGVKIANTFIKEGFARGVIGIEEVMEKTRAFWKDATGKDLSADEIAAIKKEIEPTFTFGNIKIGHDWIKDLVQQGFDTIEKLVPEVMRELKKEYPEITERQVRDLITGYGKVVNPSKDEINTLIRKIKRFGRIKSVIEDLHNKKRPLKSGLQRDKPDTQERGLMREIRELLKDVPVDEVTESNQLKTALDAKKTRLKNRIDDLNDALKKGKKIANKEQALTDEEIEELTALRDFNQAIYDEVFKGEKAEQRINRLVKGYETAIEKIRYRIENLDQEIVTARKDEVKEPIVKEMKDRLDNLMKFYNQMREDAGLAELDRLDNLIANAEKITKKYEEKLKTGDFARREMKTSYLGVETGIYQAQLDEMKDRLKYAENKAEAQKDINTLEKFIAKIEELQKVQAERERVRDEFTKEQLKNELANREKWEKNLDKFLDAASIPRQLNAGFEFSSVFIQGRTYTIHFAKQDILSAAKQLLTGKKQEYHTIKNFENMFKSWWSQETHDLNTAKLTSNESWKRAKQSKLAIHDKDVAEEAKTEARGKAGGEIISTKLISTLFDKLALPLKWLGFDKAYKKWTDINLSKKFERSAQMYLNAVRFQRYLQLEEKIRKEGKNFISNPDDYKQAASAINTLSGATNVGVFEGKFMKWSPLFFYSFRMMVSVLKQVSPLAFLHLAQLHAKGDPKMKLSVAQKAAMSDFAVSVGLQAMLMVSFAAMMQSATGDDDDWTVELDPRSSKFMQIRVKGKDGHVTYIDAWGGLRTAIVLQMRLISGEVKNRNGELKGLGSRNVPTGKELVTDYVINKASPLIQPAWYWLARKQKVNKNTGETIYTDAYGNEFAFANEVGEKLYPMYFNSIYEMKDTQTPEVATFGALLGLFGVNTNTYDETPKKKK